MLDEYRDLYKVCASLVPDALTMDKNDLCRLCIAHEKSFDYDNYVGALIYRYWPLISKYYAMSTNLAEPEDCYNWLVDTVLYTLKHRQWENPDSNIYNDPKGPDKVINRCMKSSRLIFYQFQNRKKRRKDYQFISIESLKESMNSDSIDIEDDTSLLDDASIDIHFMIQHIFNKKEYFLAFILDFILIEDVFDLIDDRRVFNIKRLSKYFRKLDADYVKSFADKYELNYDVVYQAAILAKNIPDSKLTGKIEDTLLRLKHSEFIKNINLSR